MRKSQKKKYNSIAIASIFTIGSVSIIQYSLWIPRHASITVHWLVILFVVPFFNGLISAAIVSSGANAVAFFSSLISTSVLFLLYKYWFWHSSPSFFAALIFSLNLTFFSAFGVMAYKNMHRLFSRKQTRKRKKTNILIYIYHALAIISAIVTIIGYLFKR